MLAFEQLEPFGGVADDWRAGQVASTIANVHRDPEKRREAFGPEDFMPSLRALTPEPEALLLEDPEAQSALIDRMLFGRGNA